ncbi:MAG TPA: PKD domain-containing protein [Candidatus Polarisedimenticolaceae bacterium]|nr:PKD domain-containing protein [Candidatus Polarisedimenticolaceae bacterium]
MRGAWLGIGVLLAASGVLAAPPVIPDVPAREIEVTAEIGDVSAPDRGLVALSDGSGAATLLVREAGHLRSQRSSDGGATWLPEVEVTAASSRPVLDHEAVLASDGALVAVWAAPDPAGDRALYLSRSADHGASWTSPVAVVHAGLPGHGAELFSVAAGGGGRTAIVWSDGATQSVHARVTLNGTTWQDPVAVFTALEEGGPVIQSLDVGLGPGGDVHVVLVQDRLDFTLRLYTSRSTDGGKAFDPVIERTQQFPVATPRPRSADLEVDDDGTVLIAALLQGAGRLGLLRSTDGGLTFAGSTPVTIQGTNNSVTPILTSWTGTPNIAVRCVEGAGRLVFALSTDGGVGFLQWKFGPAPQPDALGSAVARTPTGRTVVSYVDRSRNDIFLPPPPMVIASSTVDGSTWTGARVDDLPGPFQRVPVSLGLVTGPAGLVTVVWEDPRPDAGTTSIWHATAPAETMQFGASARVDSDAAVSRLDAFPQPTVASDGGAHVMAVFPAAARSELNDLHVATSSDGGHTFAPPQRIGSDAVGERNNVAPAAALAPDGVGWVLSEVSAPGSNLTYALRVFRTADFGESFPEEPIFLYSGTYDGLVHVAMAGSIGLAAWVDGGLEARLARGGGPGTSVTQTLLSTSSETAAVCADGQDVTVVYQEGENLVGKQSADAGETFGPAHSLHAHPQYVHVACAGDQATAVWLGPGDQGATSLHPGEGGIRTANLGPSGWSNPITLGPASFALPHVVRRGTLAFAAWDENGKIWIARSGDGATTWTPAERLDESNPGGVHDPTSWNVEIATDVTGRLWAFWEEKLGAEASVVVRRSDDGGSVWRKMRRVSREQPQHAMARHGFPYNARVATVPGAALLAYAGPLTSDWRSVFVNADDALDADRDGHPNDEDCAPEDPDRYTCSSPPVAAAGANQTVECTGNLAALVHLDGTASVDPDGDLASYLWTEQGASLADTSTADVMLPLGAHTVTLTVSDSTGASDTDDVAIDVVDTQPPAGGLTFPVDGACYGPAQVPVVLDDDAADVCDPAPEKNFTPAMSFDAHGDHLATLRVQDAAGLLRESSVAFTVDLVPPMAGIARSSGRIDPGHLPLLLGVTGSDDDGASGGVLHERLFLDGCLALDGDLEGDGDGLLSDETLSLAIGDLCSLAARCGFAVLAEPELRLEAVDCAGNVGSATARLGGAFPAGICRSPRGRRLGPGGRSVSLDRR